MKTRKYMPPVEPEVAHMWRLETVAELQTLVKQALPNAFVEKLLQPEALKCHRRQKGYLLLEPDYGANEAHFLRSGIAILYAVDPKTSKKNIFYIWQAGDIVVLYGRFKDKLPNDKYYIELLGDSELVTITNLCMKNVYEEHQIAYVLTNEILALKIERRERHLQILLNPDKDERYVMFANLFPELRGRLSNEHLSAFLSISLSKVKECKYKFLFDRD